MSEKNTGGPAFPVNYSNENDGPTIMPSEGMTLRDYFAAKAMQPLIGMVYSGGDISAKDGGKVTEDVLAQQAYYFADAMLKAREA